MRSMIALCAAAAMAAPAFTHAEEATPRDLHAAARAFDSDWNNRVRATTTAAAVRAADIAFEQRAQTGGTAKAFREFMDRDDGLQFNGPPR